MKAEDQKNLYDALHDRVVNGEFPAERRLRPDVFADEYKCSASTIREILFRLSTVGLVDFREQRGFRMPPMSIERKNDLTRFRIVLECEGACLSIRQGGLAWEARLSAAHHKLSHIEAHIPGKEADSEVMALWTLAELEFHQTLIDACGSDILKSTHAVIYQQFRQQMITTDRTFQFLPENVIQHQAILAAALAHDEPAMRDTITAHLLRNVVE